MGEERMHWLYSTCHNFDRQGGSRACNRGGCKLERLGRRQGERAVRQAVAEQNDRMPFSEEGRPPAKSCQVEIEVQIPCDCLGDSAVTKRETIGSDVAARQLLRIAEVRQGDAGIQLYRANRKSMASLEKEIIVEHTAPEVLHFLRDRVLRGLGEVPCGCADAQGEVEAALPRLPGQVLR